MELKLVAITKIYKNIGTDEMPMWRHVDGNEYIISFLDEEPTWPKIGEEISKFQHILEGKIEADVKEVYVGFELFPKDSLTHSEVFQLETGGTIDFPAQDATKIDVTELMDGLNT